MKVFLGGTVNNSTWRARIIPKLSVDYFNPIVEEWTEQAQANEIFEREHCDYCLYVITPRMTGYYAIAEIIDDSFKRPDRTIYCYLKQDDEFVFSDSQIEELEKIKTIVEHNGGLFLETLDDVVRYLNSANSIDKSTINEEIKDVFISYGRRHSLDFARKLHDRLVSNGQKVWFDMNNIPLGVDFQEQIDQGIQKADNFIYVISPHSVKSEYCLKEVFLALKYNKRIIPILHIEPSDCWDKIHPEIGKRNWIYMREQADDAIPRNEWKQIDSFDISYSGLLSLINLHKDYVRRHTLLLNMALVWYNNQKMTNFLIVGTDRVESEAWLIKDTFKNEKGELTQPPCLPTLSHAEFICESKKNSVNLQTDTFLSYSVENKEAKDRIYKSLIKRGITVWLHTNDIEKGEDFEEAIKRGIEQADNFIYFISKESVISEYCQFELVYALKLNKRIIPILIDNTANSSIPSEIRKMQYIDFSACINEIEADNTEDEKLSRDERVKKDVEKRREKTPYELKFDQLLYEIQDDADYYQKHKIFLVQAIRWEKQNKNQSVLLRGYNLENAKTWLKLSENKPHKPVQLHKDFIAESEAKLEILSSEVFISYSRTDGDFARKLNHELQMAGKTTWFDQESIASSADFQKEIRRGIATSDNFVFIISPDSVKSSYCIDEVLFTKELNKRIITILSRETDVKIIPEDLTAIQWIDFDRKNFNQSFHELIRTLDIDRDYVKKHTKYSQLAYDWIVKEKDEDLLLRGSEFSVADEWILQAVNQNKKPEPTANQIAYLDESRKAIQKALKNKKNLQTTFRILLFLSIIGVFVSLYFMIMARRAMNEAKEQEKNIQALYLASISKDIMDSESVKALQLAYMAYNSNTEDTHPFIIKAFTDVFNNFISGKKAYYIDELYLSDGMYNATYTFDGTKLFTYSYDSIKIYDSDGKIISQFAAEIYDAKISNDGKTILVSNSETIKLYSLDGTLINTINAKSDYIDDFILDNDKFITFSWSNDVGIYDFTGKEISWFVAGDTLLKCYEYNKNEDKFITINTLNQLVIWDLKGDTMLFLNNYTADYPITNLNNNFIISSNSKDTVTFYNYSGDPMTSFRKRFTAKKFKLVPSGEKLIVQKADNNLYLLNSKGVQLSNFNMQDSLIDIQFSDDGKKAIVVTSSETFYMWNLEKNEIKNFKGHTDLISHAEFLQNQNFIISYSYDRSAKLWDLEGNVQLSFEGHSEEVVSHSLSNNGKLMTFSHDGTAKIWDITKIQEPMFRGHRKPIYDVVASDDGKYIATLSEDKTLKIWTEDGKQKLSFESETGFNKIVFCKNSDVFAVFEYEKVFIYSITDSLISTMLFSENYFNNLVFSDDGEYFITYSDYDYYASIYDLNGEKISEIEKLTGYIKKVIFHDENNLYFFTDNNNISKYNSKGFFKDQAFELDKQVYDIQWNDNELNILLKAFKNNNLIITKFGLSKPVVIKGIKKEISSAFFAGSNYIYITDDDNIIKFYDLSGNEISTFYENLNEIFDIKFSSSENLAIFIYNDFEIKLIDIAGGYILSEVSDNVKGATFASNGLIYLAKDNEIQPLYTISAAIKWIESNNLPVLTERDKEKYGIIKAKKEKDED